jgi:Domain of unknown function (DUF4394)
MAAIHGANRCRPVLEGDSYAQGIWLEGACAGRRYDDRYTNNDPDAATGTTLFDLDTTLDQVVIQSPPGAGILVATGKFGVDAGPQAGFDIYSLGARGTTVANLAFASLIVNGKSGFYRIVLTTGSAVRLGTFDEMVVDIAVPLNQ